jgi:uncharacterized membrane protein YphA (DoxX/SURF4 family)
MAAAAVGLRFVLAAVFLLSGLAKLPRREEFVRAVRNYQLVPDRLGGLVGRVLPPLEVAGGALLALGLGIRPVAALLALCLAAFSGAVSINLLRGRTIDCGCFGPVAQQQITWWTVARNVVLLGMAVFVAAVEPTALSLDRLLPGSPSPEVGTGSALALMFAATLAIVTTSLLQDWRRLGPLVRAAQERSLRP